MLAFISLALQVAKLFWESFKKRPSNECQHVTVRALEDADQSDPEDSGLESILFEGD